MKVPPTGTEVTFRAVVTDEQGLRIDVLEDNQTHDQVDLVLIVASIVNEGLDRARATLARREAEDED